MVKFVKGEKGYIWYNGLEDRRERMCFGKVEVNLNEILIRVKYGDP